MPVYKYTTKEGKIKWYTSFHYVDWTGKNRRKKKMGFTRRSDAQEYERHFLNAAKDDPDILFSSLVENYFNDVESRLKPTTISNKKYVVDSKILPYFKDMKLSEINAVTVRTWQNALLEYADDEGESYAGTYLKTINVQLSAIMNYAVKYYGLRQNPCHKAGSIGKSNAEEMDVWTREEFEHFLSFEPSRTYRVAFSILFYTGMREGELLALTKKDVSKDGMEITVSKNFATVKGEEMILTPKTPWSRRVLPIHKQLYDELMAYINGMYLLDDDRLFYFKKNTLLHEFNRVNRDSGLTDIRIHDLRHSHVSMLIDMNVPITEISKRLGHKNPGVTLKIYSHMYKQNARGIADRIGDLLAGETGDGEAPEDGEKT